MNATLNGTLHISGEDDQRDLVQADISSFLAEEIHGFQLGYEVYRKKFYYDISMFFGNQIINQWIATPDLLSIDNLYQVHTQATIGAYKNHNDVFGFLGFHLGHAATFANVADSINYRVQTTEEDSDPALEFHTLRMGVKLGARSGNDQGLRVGAEWGVDIHGNSDTQIMLGYFINL